MKRTETRGFSKAIGLAWFVLLLSSSTVAQTTAITGGRVHTVSGDVLENATVLIVDGTLREIGRAVDIPDGARRIDASGKVVTPGLIDAATAVGLVEVRSLGDTRDDSRDTDDPIRAAFRVTDGMHRHSIVIPITRLGGVTTAASIPSGGAVAGTGVAIDLSGAPLADSMVKDPVAMYAAFNPDAAEHAGGARGSLALLFREVFEDTRLFQDQRAAFESGALRSLSASRLDLAALTSVLDGSLRMVFRASRASDIEAVLRLATEYSIEVAILGGEEAWRVRGRLAENDAPVIVKAFGNLPLQFDRLGTRFDNAALLSEAGVQVVISTIDTHNARNLRFEAGQAVRHGMEWERALEAITLEPARLLGIADTHGSLEPGKRANIVVWSGDPFEPASAPEHVILGGREVARDSRQLRLLERYRSLEDGPVGYRATSSTSEN